MKKIVYNYCFYGACFLMFLSIYCKMAVSYLGVLSKTDIEVIVSFIIGNLFSGIMLFLLHYLSRQMVQ